MIPRRGGRSGTGCWLSCESSGGWCMCIEDRNCRQNLGMSRSKCMGCGVEEAPIAVCFPSLLRSFATGRNNKEIPRKTAFSEQPKTWYPYDPILLSNLQAVQRPTSLCGQHPSSPSIAPDEYAYAYGVGNASLSVSPHCFTQARVLHITYLVWWRSFGLFFLYCFTFHSLHSFTLVTSSLVHAF
ncbi:hypothetical protein JVT61DRAFT_6881 [Boletus reticuloceps]|uniref:Uncharacterized protein n=1 Tax=Boletus reticuloceps TaxID=495285 RepID=A0A8I2YJ33_9AGAM|nr:hypothetical protein JVT61DRAFT_6881 [Boletus reticuloceps]